MAGIGFELKKVLSVNSLTSFFKASISGIFIVSGPWLLSILSLSITTLIIGKSHFINDFFSILVYIYSFSLLISGGFQYIVIRLFADYIYNNRIGEALYHILVYLAISGLISFGLSFSTLSIITGKSGIDSIVIISSSYLCAVINMLWIVLIFVSYLKYYWKIFISFIMGIIYIALTFIISENITLNRLIYSYATSNLIVLTALLILSIKSYKPEIIPVLSVLKDYYGYVSKYIFLFLTGSFYYIAFWSDKLLFWFIFGERTDFFGLKLFEPYDVSVYIGNLSIIPGMVYYVIESETVFYTRIKKFLISLANSEYGIIKQRAKELKESADSVMINQTFFQTLLVAALSLVSYKINPANYLILIISFWGVNFQLIAFSYINFLFYMDCYKHCFYIVFVMALTNILLFFILIHIPDIHIPGISYLISTMLGALLSIKLFNYDVRRLDRYIYSSIK